MNPIGPINPTIPSPRVRRPEEKVKRREPGREKDPGNMENSGGKPVKPDADDHQLDELA